MLWLLTGELNVVSLNWFAIVNLVIVQFLIIDGIRWTSSFIATLPAQSDVRFHWSPYLFGTSRPQAIIEITRSIAILLAAFLSGSLPWYLLATLSVCYGIHLFLMTILVILSFKTFPVSNARNKWTYFFMVTPWVSLVISLGLLLPRVQIVQFLPSFRISVLIVALSYLAVMFGNALRTSVAMPVLSDLRRKLVAGRISASEAVNSIEIALGGMEVADALRTDVLEIISLLERMDEQTKNAIMSLSSIESNLPTSEDSPPEVSNKRETIDSLKAGYQFFLGERQKLTDQHRVQAEQFFKNVARVRVIPTAVPTIEEFARILQARAVTTDSNFNRVVEREDEVGKKLDAAFPRA